MHEIKLPQLGQSVEEASIVQWIRKEGDAVKQGDILFSVQTDKAEIECESTASGVLRKILVQPDVEVPVMTVVALVGEPDEPLPDVSQYGAGGQAPSAQPPAPTQPGTASPAPAPAGASGPITAVGGDGGHGASPRARKKAEELGVDTSAVAGTGPRGRVIEADVVAHAAAGATAARITPTAKRMAELSGVDVSAVTGTGPRGKIMKEDVTRATTSPAAHPAPAPAASSATGEDRRVPLTPMRRIIAERMVQSLFTAPHYYITLEVDMAAASAYRKAAAGFRPSFNDIMLYAAGQALRKHPQVNARWAGDAIDEIAGINLGFAVALPAGLIVPVVRDVQNLSLEGVHQAAAALVEKARNGRLVPDDYTGSTFTISNLGSFGVDEFTAIINQPNSAILAVGRIKEKPVVVDGGIHIRPMMNMTLSSDHRVIDGAQAAQFMATLRGILEKAQF